MILLLKFILYKLKLLKPTKEIILLDIKIEKYKIVKRAIKKLKLQIMRQQILQNSEGFILLARGKDYYGTVACKLLTREYRKLGFTVTEHPLKIMGKLYETYFEFTKHNEPKPKRHLSVVPPSEYN